MSEEPLKKFDPNNLIPNIDNEIEKKGEIFTTQSNIEAPTPGDPIKVTVDENKQQQLLKYVDDCNQLQGYYVEKHEELKMVFALLLNLFQIYKYSVNLMGAMKTDATAATDDICYFPKRIVFLNINPTNPKPICDIEIFKNLPSGTIYWRIELLQEGKITRDGKPSDVGWYDSPTDKIWSDYAKMFEIDLHRGAQNKKLDFLRIKSMPGDIKDNSGEESKIIKLTITKNYTQVYFHRQNEETHKAPNDLSSNPKLTIGKFPEYYGLDGKGLNIKFKISLYKSLEDRNNLDNHLAETEISVYHIDGTQPISAPPPPGTIPTVIPQPVIPYQLPEPAKQIEWKLFLKETTQPVVSFKQVQLESGTTTKFNFTSFALTNLNGEYYFTREITTRDPTAPAPAPATTSSITLNYILKEEVKLEKIDYVLDKFENESKSFTVQDGNYIINIVENHLPTQPSITELQEPNNVFAKIYNIKPEPSTEGGEKVKLVFNEYNEKIQKLRKHQKELMGKIEQIAPIITSPEFKTSYDADAPTEKSENFVETNKKKLEELNKLKKGGSINPKQLAKLSNNTLSKTQQKMNINTMINNLIGGFVFYNPTAVKLNEAYYILFILEVDNTKEGTNKVNIDTQKEKAVQDILDKEKRKKINTSFLEFKKNHFYKAILLAPGNDVLKVYKDKDFEDKTNDLFGSTWMEEELIKLFLTNKFKEINLLYDEDKETRKLINKTNSDNINKYNDEFIKNITGTIAEPIKTNTFFSPWMKIKQLFETLDIDTTTTTGGP